MIKQKPKHMKVLILTDNSILLKIALILQDKYREVDIFQSPNSSLNVPVIRLKTESKWIINKYDLVFSLHCKQIFPQELVQKVRCINIHPGYNPYNRGWFPHVFSILNGGKAGVTIHEMDQRLDHGKIIIQKECPINAWDTSETVYKRIIEIEKKVILDNYEMIRDKRYVPIKMKTKGNINYIKDYEKLKKIDLDEKGSFRAFINRLRALTHGSYKNAHFLDDKGNKIYLRLILKKEKPRLKNLR